MRLVSEIANRVDQETIVVIDGGDAAKWGNLVIPAAGPGQYLSIAGTSFGPLGVGIPYAMAAKLAHPDKKGYFCSPATVPLAMAPWSTTQPCATTYRLPQSS
ncbi:MAG: thiamine pyrophosphate-dependent enzyme [Bacillota bacterium]